jgi:signal transduction histidine kinase
MYSSEAITSRETAGIPAGQASLVARLDQVARLTEAAGLGPSDAEHRQQALRLALSLARRSPTGPAEAGPQVVFAAALLRDIAVDLVADIPSARRLLDDLEEIVGVSRAAVGRELLRGSELAQLPVDVALEVELALLLLLTGAASVSLWTLLGGGAVRAICQAGDHVAADAEVERAASQLLGTRRRAQWASGREWVGRVVERGQLPAVALVAYGGAGGPADSDLFLEAAAPQIAGILDRTELLAASDIDSPPVIVALERRIARLRYDLHDGPQQDVHLLALDLRLFRDQLGSILEGHRDAARLMGRLDDLEAQLVALDSELRQISSSMQSPFLSAGTLPEALEEITSAFSSRTAIEPEVDLSGDFSRLSDSQQITLLALVREALNNVHKHSQASRVTITIAAHSRGVDAQVTDNGRGFDPEQTLVQAAREGHLGVVGIHERVRMLGGHARIESRAGGPTVISVTIPSWIRA